MAGDWLTWHTRTQKIAAVTWEQIVKELPLYSTKIGLGEP